MQVEGQQRLPAAPEIVWDGLMDPEVLKRCIPGCKSLEKAGDNLYNLEIELGIAAIKGRYKGKVEIKDANPPESYTLSIQAEGSPGFVSTDMPFNLQADGDGTILSYDGQAEVGGMIASVGQRMVGGVAKLVAKQFFDALVREVSKQTS